MSGRAGSLLPFGRLGTVAYCVVLTLLFLFVGFPLDRVGQRLVASLSGATGTTIRFAELSPTLSLGGPGFEAREVRVVGSDGTPLSFDRLRVRPAWSSAWLRLTPALHVDAEGPLGRGVGVVVVDAETPGFAGDLIDVDLGELPVDALWPGVNLTGTLAAEIDLAARRDAAGPEGTVTFQARKGGLSATGLNVGLPYETLTGDLELGGEALVRIVSLRADSPMLSADATGEIGPSAHFVTAPLDIEIRLQVQPGLAGNLRGLGLAVDASGAAIARLGGTPAAPELR